jgi:hypothetical protein
VKCGTEVIQRRHSGERCVETTGEALQGINGLFPAGQKRKEADHVLVRTGPQGAQDVRHRVTFLPDWDDE